MKKYALYRSLGFFDKEIYKHISVAIEYGADIDSVTDKLLDAAGRDALSLTKYYGLYNAEVYDPKPVDKLRRPNTYDYVIMVVLRPKNGGENDIIDYGVMVSAYYEGA
jgi:hypothetical protein